MRRLFVFVLAAVLLMGLAVPGHAGKSRLSNASLTCTYDPRTAFMDLQGSVDVARWNRTHYVFMSIFRDDRGSGGGFTRVAFYPYGDKLAFTGTVSFTDTTQLPRDYHMTVDLVVERGGTLRIIEQAITSPEAFPDLNTCTIISSS